MEMEGKNHPSLFSLGPLGKAPSKAPTSLKVMPRDAPGTIPPDSLLSDQQHSFAPLLQTSLRTSHPTSCPKQGELWGSCYKGQHAGPSHTWCFFLSELMVRGL